MTRLQVANVMKLSRILVRFPPLALVVAALLGATPLVGTAAIDIDWIPDDVVVSNPDTSTTDPEFDPVNGFAAWQFGPNPRLQSGRLLVARIDPVDGALLDAVTGLPLNGGGRGLELDRDLVSRDVTKNGPEFAFALEGSRLLYVKYNSQGETNLAQAVFDGVEWTTELLVDGNNRITPEGSKDLDDLTPRMAYFGFPLNEQGIPVRRLGVRIVDWAFTERFVADAEIDGASFLPNESALLVTSLSADGLRQVFYYDYDGDVLTQITSDLSLKTQSPEPWSAPELNGETLFAIGVKQFFRKPIVRVYGRDQAGVWKPFFEFRSPDSAKPFITAPVPFVYEGMSYITFRTQVTPGQDLDSDIWVVNGARTASTRVFRKVSGDDITSRYDQEFYITESGPVIYYTELLEDGLQRIRRCKTGIEPGMGGMGLGLELR